MSEPRDRKPITSLTTGWVGRTLATGRIAKSAVRLASRGLLGRKDGAIDGTIGDELAAELDKMKGIAMKVGQILSYFEGVLPDETHAALRKLQRGAEPLAWEALAPVLEAAFERPVRELFDSIDTTPVASASIGQVHRAVYAGSPVAVKIQYPGVEQMFEADFARVAGLARVASLATAVDGAALARELRDGMLEECDYVREADHQEAFAKAFSKDPAVIIPAVIRARTAATVLTTRWHDGEDFYGFVERSGAERRSAAGIVLARFAYQSLFGLGAINADPHPGNYLFPEGRAVVFLDFGSVRRFEPDYVEREAALAKIVISGRRAQFVDALLATSIVSDPDRFDFDAHWSLMRHQYEPYISARFEFTFDYVRRAMAFSRPGNPNLRRLAIPPPWIWQQRLQWGLHAVLARLHAEGPFRDVLLEAMSAERRPLVVPSARNGLAESSDP